MKPLSSFPNCMNQLTIRNRNNIRFSQCVYCSYCPLHLCQDSEKDEVISIDFALGPFYILMSFDEQKIHVFQKQDKHYCLELPINAIDVEKLS